MRELGPPAMLPQAPHADTWLETAVNTVLIRRTFCGE